MTRAEIVDLVFLKVTGGQDSQDVNIERLEINAYFGEAMAAAIEDENEQRLIMAKREGKPYVIDSEFTQNFILELKEDENRCLKYVTPVKRWQSLHEDAGVRNVASKNLCTNFVKLKMLSQLQGVDLPGAYYTIGTFDGEQRVYLKGVPVDVEEITLDYVVLPKDYGDEDEVAAPGSAINMAIERMTQHFIHQRSMPQDETNNANDSASND